MPYSQRQARAIFLDLQRRKGLEAAKTFGRKHRGDLAGDKRAAGRPYRARRRRSS